MKTQYFKTLKTQLVVLFGTLCLFFSCHSDVSEIAADLSGFDQMLEDYYQERIKLFPIEATSAGDHRYNDQLPNELSDAFVEKYKNFIAEYQKKLSSFDREILDPNDKMSYDILKWELDIQQASFEYKKDLTPIDQMWSKNLFIGQLASGASAQPFNNIKEYEDWLKRLDSYVDWMNSTENKMREGMEKGYVLPKPLIQKVIPQLDALDHGPVEQHLFYSPIKNLPSAMTGEDKDRITAQYTSMVRDKIIPAYARLKNFMQNEYLPVGRESTGIDAVPMGADFYNHMIKLFTTTEMSADEIFNLGKSEVERLRNEMLKVKDQVGFTGDLNSFFNYVRDKEELMPFTDAQQVIDHFNAIHEKMKPNLTKLFELTPKSKFEVRRTEAFREASASAEYNPGSIDGTRPGIFYVPIPNVKSYNIVSDEDLFLHEAIPGHHYQISLQQENSSLPSFRKTLWYSAYGEGWALYTESLGSELGLYTDPYQYFGMLSAEMHRAIRLVVDAGMHAKGWTREQAIQYSLENEAGSEEGIISEIERYMAMPGQALSYKIGQLKIIELRKKAEVAFGDDFDSKVFHRKVLEDGCVPLKLLADKINLWIAEK